MEKKTLKAFLKAAKSGDVLRVAEYLGRGVEEEDCDDARIRPPLLACCEKGRVGAARLLIAAGWHVDAYTADHDRTPLMAAAAGGHAAIVEALLRRGAEPNLVDEDGWSALHYCSYNAHGDVDYHAYSTCVAHLITHGADTTKHNNDGFNPGDYNFAAIDEIAADLPRFLVPANFDAFNEDFKAACQTLAVIMVRRCRAWRDAGRDVSRKQMQLSEDVADEKRAIVEEASEVVADLRAELKGKKRKKKASTAGAVQASGAAAASATAGSGEADPLAPATNPATLEAVAEPGSALEAAASPRSTTVKAEAAPEAVAVVPTGDAGAGGAGAATAATAAAPAAPAAAAAAAAAATAATATTQPPLRSAASAGDDDAWAAPQDREAMVARVKAAEKIEASAKAELEVAESLCKVYGADEAVRTARLKQYADAREVVRAQRKRLAAAMSQRPSDPHKIKEAKASVADAVKHRGLARGWSRGCLSSSAWCRHHNSGRSRASRAAASSLAHLIVTFVPHEWFAPEEEEVTEVDEAPRGRRSSTVKAVVFQRRRSEMWRAERQAEAQRDDSGGGSGKKCGGLSVRKYHMAAIAEGSGDDEDDDDDDDDDDTPNLTGVEVSVAGVRGVRAKAAQKQKDAAQPAVAEEDMGQKSLADLLGWP